eukprot:7953527-Pyramimonas_sp.AAC.1
MSLDEYLDKDGKQELVDAFNKIVTKLKGDTFNSTSISESHWKKVVKDLKPVLTDLKALHSAVIKFQWKVKKRTTARRDDA